MTATAIADKSFSLLDLAYKYTKGPGGGMFGFVSGGFNYLFVFNSYVKPAGCGEIFTYVPTTAEPTWVMKDDATVVAEFTRDTFDAFIETFCLDGKLLKESLRSQTTSPQNYTSYHHPEKSLPRCSTSASFEYNGIYYILTNTTLVIYGVWPRYLSPYCGGGWKTLIEFNADDCSQFIRTYEIEGKTLEWILEHQREWKYKLTAEHFERVLTGFSFVFVYRGMPCYIYYSGEHGKPRSSDGRYIRIVTQQLFDVTPYAPLTPAAEHWVNHIPGYYWDETTSNQIVIGPFKKDSDLLDTVAFDRKKLREIFDTEYDDGAVLCGVFEG
jgi:hypothetical protein